MTADENKPLSREETLIRVLDRLAKQIEYLELRQKENEKFQIELFKAVERSEPRQNEANAALSELKRTFLRYHSEMGGIVSAQDSIDKEIIALAERQRLLVERQAASVFEQEQLGRNLKNFDAHLSNVDERLVWHLNNLGARLGLREKTASEHYAFLKKLDETFSARMSELGRRVTELHMDTEKRVLQIQKETQRQIEDLQLETMRRLLALDGIEAALAEILHRTEPPEPKPPIWPVRLFRRLRGFVRAKKALARYKLKGATVSLKEKKIRRTKKRNKRIDK